MAETAQPAGIPNWGVFWFDAATHTPRVIENSGQVVQLGMTNLFNSDPSGDPADSLEEKDEMTTPSKSASLFQLCKYERMEQDFAGVRDGWRH